MKLYSCKVHRKVKGTTDRVSTAACPAIIEIHTDDEQNGFQMIYLDSREGDLKNEWYDSVRACDGHARLQCGVLQGDWQPTAD